MEYSNNNNILSKNISDLLIFILFAIVILYPDSINGPLIYIPQIIIGMVAIYGIKKNIMYNSTRAFFWYAIYMTFMSLILSTMNGSDGILSILKSSLRLYYPFLGLMIGTLIGKTLKPKTLFKIIVIFLSIQFIFSYLQINNESFRVITYKLYRVSNVEYYLQAFSWSSGRRAIGTVANPNLLGMLTVILNSSILILSRKFKKAKSIKLINIWCTFASIYICIYIQSRTAIILLILSIAIIGFWRIPFRGIPKVLFIFIPATVAYSVLFFIQSKVNRNLNISALDPRIEVWQVRIATMFEAAKYEDFFAGILGIGFHTARTIGFYDNTYVTIFVSSGIIGLMVLFAAILSVIKSVKKINDGVFKELAIILIIIWLVGNMVADYQEMFKLSIITFILLGYATHTGYISNQMK